MKIKSGVVFGLLASLALFVAFALAQQTDSGMQQSTQDSGQMKQKGAMMQDPQTVKQVQQALSNQGYDPGPASGKWGSKTQKALKKYQRAQGLNATGQIDQQTLASLGVGGGAAAGGQQQNMPSQQPSAGEQQGGMSGQQSGAGGQQGSMQDQQSQQGGGNY